MTQTPPGDPWNPPEDPSADPVRRGKRAEHRGGLLTGEVRIKPLEDRIVVQANEPETTTASGIVIPDTARDKPQEGTVLAVGPGRIDDNGNRVPLDVRVGDTVLYSKYGGTEIKYAGEEYIVLQARDILAIVDEGSS